MFKWIEAAYTDNNIIATNFQLLKTTKCRPTSTLSIDEQKHKWQTSRTTEKKTNWWRKENRLSMKIIWKIRNTKKNIYIYNSIENCERKRKTWIHVAQCSTTFLLLSAFFRWVFFYRRCYSVSVESLLSFIPRNTYRYSLSVNHSLFRNLLKSIAQHQLFHFDDVSFHFPWNSSTAPYPKLVMMRSNRRKKAQKKAALFQEHNERYNNKKWSLFKLVNRKLPSYWKVWMRHFPPIRIKKSPGFTTNMNFSRLI